MRFISLFTHEPTGQPPTQELMTEMGKLIEEGMKAGWLLGTEGVQWGSAGTKVRAVRGEVTITDGPFTEAKEAIGGYALLAAKSKDEAIALCRRFLKVAGDGQCELHQLFDPPPGGPPR
jgi:hypothetical protein